MSLLIRPLPQTQKLELAATPYLEDKTYWIEGLRLLQRAMAPTFTPGKRFGNFEVAQWLDVHRAIADEWIFALIRHELATTCIIPLSATIADCDAADGFILQVPANRGSVSVTTPSELRAFDPWEDRTLDDVVPDTRYPDAYIDKYYVVGVDESYIVHRKRRKRKNGIFVPVKPDEHPRYAHTTEAHQDRTRATCIAPIDWKAVIDKAATETD